MKRARDCKLRVLSELTDVSAHRGQTINKLTQITPAYDSGAADGFLNRYFFRLDSVDRELVFDKKTELKNS